MNDDDDDDSIMNDDDDQSLRCMHKMSCGRYMDGCGLLHVLYDIACGMCRVSHAFVSCDDRG